MNMQRLLAPFGTVLLLAGASALLGAADTPGLRPTGDQVGHLVQPSADVARETADGTFDVLWSQRITDPTWPGVLDPSPPRGHGRQTCGRQDTFSLAATLPLGCTNIWEGDMDHDGAKELWYGQEQLGPVQVWEVTGDNTFELVHTAGPPTSY